MYEEWIYYYGIEENDQVKKQNVIFLKYLCKSGLNVIDHKDFCNCLDDHDANQVGPGEKFAMSLDTSDTLVALVSKTENWDCGSLVNISANQVLRQAVSDSLDTFASVVNTACESDLDGEVKSSSSLS